jgi:cadmium resistance protein CadD (predicted permease)
MINERQIIRNWLKVFILALLLSGFTAIPVEQELTLLIKHFPFEGSIKGWLQEVLLAVQQTGKYYPFLFYGYDWLAFAHFILAILFIGPYRNPVKNKWVIEFGIIACVLIIPFALIAGHFRGMPFWWRIIDCLFGIIGLIPLGICLHKINKLEKEEREEERDHLFQYSVSS